MGRRHVQRQPVQPYCQSCPTCPPDLSWQVQAWRGQTAAVQSQLVTTQTELGKTKTELTEAQKILGEARDCFKEVDPQKQLQCLKLQLVYK